MKFNYTIPFVFLILLLFACRPDDNFVTDPSAVLEFSKDTMTFDTVFTELGSATRILKVYNRNDRPIKIDKVSVATGSNSKFRFNIDGESTNEMIDLEIPAEDSIYIFGEVTVDPDQDISASPFVITDELVFQTNGNEQKVILEAWGQNANYFPSRFSSKSGATFACDGMEVVWNDPKPYVIYGIVAFENCDLVIPAGTQIYVHGGLGLVFNDDGEGFFYNDGRIVIGANATLRTEGTKENPVVIQGDRLEAGFEDVRGQWYGVIFAPGSTGSVLEHTIIKNSVVGVAVDSSSSLSLNNTEIYNTTANAVFARHAEVKARNCLFRDNSANSVRISQGGNYEFDYCTMATYGTDASALSVSNVRCLDAFCTEFFDNDLNARFSNCIITGSQEDQINLADLSDNVTFNYAFDHCIVRLKDILEADSYPDFLTDCGTCINNTDRDAPLFVDRDDGDYHLDSLSIAEGQAAPIMDILLDLDEEERDPTTPDIGCYEYIYE